MSILARCDLFPKTTFAKGEATAVARRTTGEYGLFRMAQAHSAASSKRRRSHNGESMAWRTTYMYDEAQ